MTEDLRNRSVMNIASLLSVYEEAGEEVYISHKEYQDGVGFRGMTSTSVTIPAEGEPYGRLRGQKVFNNEKRKELEKTYDRRVLDT